MRDTNLTVRIRSVREGVELIYSHCAGKARHAKIAENKMVITTKASPQLPLILLDLDLPLAWPTSELYES